MMVQPVHSKGDQSWVFFGRNDAKAETPGLWPPHRKSWLIGKDSDAGRDWGQEEKGTTEGEIAGWHHRLDGHEFGWTPGVGDGQGGLECCNSWGRKESDTTEWLNWTKLNVFTYLEYSSILAKVKLEHKREPKIRWTYKQIVYFALISILKQMIQLSEAALVLAVNYPLRHRHHLHDLSTSVKLA